MLYLQIRSVEANIWYSIIDMGAQHNTNKEQRAFQANHPSFEKAVVNTVAGVSNTQATYQLQRGDFQAWRDRVEGRKEQLNHQFLLLPLRSNFIQDKEMCSNGGVAVVNYPYYPLLLSREIQDRKENKEYFKEGDLWYLLYALTAAKYDLKNYGGIVGDIRPENIFLNSQRKIKVLNLLSTPHQKTAYAKALQHFTQQTFLLPPEDLSQLKKSAIDNKNNTVSQIFSIGATIMKAGLLDDFKDVYDSQLLKFSSEAFTQKKDQWSDHSKYSQIFKSIILNLVDQNPERRIKVQDLMIFVSKYENQIKAREQFLITKAPENLQSGVSLIRSRVR